MKKRGICLLLSLLLSLSLLPLSASAADRVMINETNFPDPNFRNWLLENTPHKSILDIGEGGHDIYFYSDEDIAQILMLYIERHEIRDLKGIEYFTALTFLDCHSNKITALDLSQNTALGLLDCGNNELKELDMSNQPELLVLQCANNDLDALDVSGNPKLEVLSCSGNPGITSLDVSKNPNLRSLGCYGCGITELDITKNPKLSAVYQEKYKKDTDGHYEYLCKTDDGEEYILAVDYDTKVIAAAPQPEVKKPVITTQPKSATVKAGKKATFKVKATGTGLKYQWYVMKTGSKKWTKVKSATKATLKVKATKKMNGYKYRCKVYNTAGYKYSKTVKLKVKK